VTVGPFFSYGEMKHVKLHCWLSTQHHGLRTYKFLKQKLIGRASADPVSAENGNIRGLSLETFRELASHASEL
jgi:hypothetical protein